MGGDGGNTLSSKLKQHKTSTRKQKGFYLIFQNRIIQRKKERGREWRESPNALTKSSPPASPPLQMLPEYPFSLYLTSQPWVSLSTPSLFMASSSSSSFFFPAAGTRSLFRVDTAGFPSCRRPTMTQLKKISKSCCIRADLDSNVSDMRTNGTPFPPSFLFLTLYLLILIYGFCSNSNFKYWFVILLVNWICKSIFFSLLWLEVI